jgi:hypothetical protein
MLQILLNLIKEKRKMEKKICLYDKVQCVNFVYIQPNMHCKQERHNKICKDNIEIFKKELDKSDFECPEWKPKPDGGPPQPPEPPPDVPPPNPKEKQFK